MGRAACTELQCLYKGALYLYLTAVLAVLGPVRGNEQKVLQSSFQTKSGGHAQLLPNFLPYRIFRGVLQ